MSKKVLFVATVVKTHIMQFHIPYLKMFKEMGWETAVASRNDYEYPKDCVIPHCDTYFNIPFERKPLKPGNIVAYRALKEVIDSGDYDIIHCHTPVGGMLGRLAAKAARKKGAKVMYTAHGFHFFKGAPLLNWLIYYPAERFFAKYTDVLITINKEDYARAQNFKAKKLYYVPGVGIDTARFSDFKSGREEKRRELGIDESSFVLLSVGELIKRKNHTVVLKAIAQMKAEPIYEKLYYVVCGRGNMDADLKRLAKDLSVDDKVLFLGYRRDIAEICNASDLFMFMSFQEGLPVALMEAMACGLPAVCSKIRGNTDLIEDGKSGFVAENTPVAVAAAIKKMASDPKLCKAYAAASKKLMHNFELNSVVERMKEIYLD